MGWQLKEELPGGNRTTTLVADYSDNYEGGGEHADFYSSFYREWPLQDLLET